MFVITTEKARPPAKDGHLRIIKQTPVYLTEDMIAVYRLISDIATKSYSLQITVYNNMNRIISEKCIKDITKQKETAKLIFELSVKNTVIPSNAYECIDAMFDII